MDDRRRAGKRERRCVNDTLRAFYKSHLFRVEEDNDRFFNQVMRVAGIDGLFDETAARSQQATRAA